MKLHNKILTSLAIAAFAFTSCDKEFDKINTDPNKPSEVPTYGLLTKVQRTVAYTYNGAWQGQRMGGLPSQHWVQSPYTDEDRYDFAERTGSVATFFTLTYSQIEILNQIIALNSDTPSLLAAPYGSAALQIGSATILRAYLIEQNVETFGDIPYTEANKLKEGIIKPKYDTQKSIFEGLIAELKGVNTALAAIETTGKGWSQGDLLFDGSISKWRRFGNSLRLRLAMRMSNIDPALSATEASSAIADGVMESNDDNAVVNFIGSGTPANAPLYQSFLTRNDFSMSWQLTNLMKGNNDDAIGFVNPYGGILDPRLNIYALSPDDIADGLTTATEGIPVGLQESESGTVKGLLAKAKTLQNYAKTSGKPNNAIPVVIQPDFRVTFMDYANVALFAAEHKGGDADYFKKGVEASMSMWKVDADLAAAYVADAMVKFNAATAEGKLELIITQKYIHNFAQTMAEPWTEYRRTEYPKSMVLPNQQTGPKFADIAYIFTTADASHGTRIIDRMKYSALESTANTANLAAAVQSIGGDAQNIPLWWSKSYKK